MTCPLSLQARAGVRCLETGLSSRISPHPNLLPGGEGDLIFPLARDCTVADIVAVEHAFPADRSSQFVGGGLGLRDALAERGGAQHAAAGGDDLAVLIDETWKNCVRNSWPTGFSL